MLRSLDHQTITITIRTSRQRITVARRYPSGAGLEFFMTNEKFSCMHPYGLAQPRVDVVTV
jgi:hypothetical protein